MFHNAIQKLKMARFYGSQCISMISVVLTSWLKIFSRYNDRDAAPHGTIDRV